MPAPLRIVGKHVEGRETVEIRGAWAIPYARTIRSRRGVHQQRAVSSDRLSAQHQGVPGIGHEITEDAGKSRGRVEPRDTERLVDGLREFGVLSLPASKKESPVLADGPARFKAELVQLDFGFGCSLRAGERLVGVERGIAQKLEGRAMKIIGSAACGHRHRSSAVAALLRRVVVGADL